MNEFVTIKENVDAKIIEKKSKFIVKLFYVEKCEDAENIIKEVKKEFFDARHNCFAYRVIENNSIIEKSSDDGEPSGTAGSPMLKILQTNNLANVLVIVTRYFGGILLGTGGLVRAYSDSLKLAISKSIKITKCPGIEFEVELLYSEFENFKYYCKMNDINIVNTDYAENIVCKIEMEDSKKQKILNDFDTKSVNLNYIKELSKKYVVKNV